MAQNASGKKPMLGVFALAMINVVIIASLRALPLMAEEGFSLVFFFLAAAFIFLIPSALVSAELATGWPKTGGVYVFLRRHLANATVFWQSGCSGYRMLSGIQ